MAGLQWRQLRIVAGLIIGCCLLTPPVSALELGGAEASLRSTTEYRLQWSDSPADYMVTDENSDQDFFETLSADVIWQDKGLSFSTMVTYAKDLDGTRSGSIFQDYTDSRGSHRQDFECYYAYLEKSGLFTDALTVRAGRQYAYGAENIQFDGLWARYDLPQLLGLEIEAFGGLITQHYDDLGPSGIGGANLRIRPLPGLAIDLNAVIFEETSWETALYWQPSDSWKLRSRVAFINDHTRFIDGGVETTIAATGTVLDFSIYRRYDIASEADFLFDFSYTLDEALSSEMNRLYLMQEESYLQFDVRVSQPIPFVHGLTVFGRYCNRNLSHSDDENIYNTDFHRITAGFDLHEGFGIHGSHFSAGYSHWWEKRDKFYEGESTSWFADLEQELFQTLEISLGYYHKSEDVNSLLENEASTSYRAAVAYKICAYSRVELAYEYAQDDFYEDELGVDHINSLTVTLDLDF
ncbi:hypothetical protein KAI46_10790 [bacterium]|nr:hypothetical protein [bacterium]